MAPHYRRQPPAPFGGIRSGLCPPRARLPPRASVIEAASCHRAAARLSSLTSYSDERNAHVHNRRIDPDCAWVRNTESDSCPSHHQWHISWTDNPHGSGDCQSSGRPRRSSSQRRLLEPGTDVRMVYGGSGPKFLGRVRGDASGTLPETNEAPASRSPSTAWPIDGYPDSRHG